MKSNFIIMAFMGLISLEEVSSTQLRSLNYISTQINELDAEKPPAVAKPPVKVGFKKSSESEPQAKLPEVAKPPTVAKPPAMAKAPAIAKPPVMARPKALEKKSR
jgi:hypothetical protein